MHSSGKRFYVLREKYLVLLISFFFCEQPPEAGGETPLCRSDVLFEALAHEVPEFIESCKNLGVRYTNIMPPNEDEESGQGRSWCSTLSTNKKLFAEERLHDLGYHSGSGRKMAASGWSHR